MQWMKIDTASVGHKYGTGKQMVKVYKHGGQQYQVYFFPIIAKKHESNDQWCTEMKEVVDQCLHLLMFVYLFLSVKRVKNV